MEWGEPAHVQPLYTFLLAYAVLWLGQLSEDQSSGLKTNVEAAMKAYISLGCLKSSVWKLPDDVQLLMNRIEGVGGVLSGNVQATRRRGFQEPGLKPSFAILRDPRVCCHSLPSIF